MRSYLSVTLLLSASCFSVDESKIAIKCDELHSCPSEQVCVGGRCITASPDMGLTDQGIADLTTESGCATGLKGTPVGTAFACPGRFAVGNARNQCAPNWHICSDGAQVDLAACNKIDGFFAGDRVGYDSGAPEFAICGPDIGTGNRDIFGCGSGNSYLKDARTSCGNFNKVLSCQPSSGWDCFAGTTLDKTANNNLKDGALCCKG